MLKKVAIILGVNVAACFMLYSSIPSSYAGQVSSECYPAKNAWNSSAFGIRTDKDIAKADGVDGIVVIPTQYSYSQDYSHAYFKINVSGNGNSVTPTVSHNIWEPYLKLISTSPGVKTITAESSLNGVDWYNFPVCVNGNTTGSNLGLSVTFTEPNPKQSPPSPGNTSPSSTPNAPASTISVPTLDKINIGNEQVSPDKLATTSFDTKTDIVFSGKSIPNGKLTFYFQSNPFQETTAADKEGNWSFRLEPGMLQPGEHSLQLAVTDPATNQISAKSDPFKFNVKQAALAGENKNESFLSRYFLYFTAGLILALLGGLTGVYVIRRKRKNAEIMPEADITGTNM